MQPRWLALLAVPVVAIGLATATHASPADKGSEYAQELADTFLKGGRAPNQYACANQAITLFGKDSEKVREFENACTGAYNNATAAYR